ncbi:MAG: methylated-DNA--[protein]-cysteine S-methyltransferase [Isosphaeraceae bacterium]
MNPNETCLYFTFASPIGRLLLTSDGEALTTLHLPEERGKPAAGPPPNAKREDGAFRTAREQLESYFAGELRTFELLLRPAGTAFQRLAWDELLRIPFGTSISYAEQARRIGRRGAARAVGAANGRNPIAIVIPCHRVIGANGSLTGYGGGIALKEWLLLHEASVLENPSSTHLVARQVATLVPAQ